MASTLPPKSPDFPSVSNSVLKPASLPPTAGVTDRPNLTPKAPDVDALNRQTSNVTGTAGTTSATTSSGLPASVPIDATDAKTMSETDVQQLANTGSVQAPIVHPESVWRQVTAQDRTDAFVFKVGEKSFLVYDRDFNNLGVQRAQFEKVVQVLTTMTPLSDAKLAELTLDPKTMAVRLDSGHVVTGVPIGGNQS
jgi:hypothetical protein